MSLRGLGIGMLVLFLMGGVAFSAEDNKKLGEVVVTATHDPLPVELVGNSVTVISRGEIEASNAATAAELLKSVPGLSVVQQGSIGSVTSVFSRGGESDFTLVLIDGVPMNDPSTGAYDFSRLLADNIEQIEVVRGGGAGSVVWGAQAASGVINIITRRGAGEARRSFRAQAGSFGFYHESLSTSGGDESGHYALNFSHVRSGGHLPVKNDFQEFNGSGRLGFTLSSTSDLEFSFWTQSSSRDNSNDNGGDKLAPFVLDPQDRTKNSQFAGRINYTFELFEDWNSSLEFSRYHERVSNMDNDNGAAIDPWGYFESEFHAGRYDIEWKNTLACWDPLTVVWGVEYGEEDYESRNYGISFGFPYWGESKVSRHHWSLYTEGTLKLNPDALTNDEWVLSAGVRWDDHSLLDDEWVYNINTVYLFDEILGGTTRFHAAAGQGYKLPNVFELGTANATFTPNPNLTGEHYFSWEAGVDQTFWEDRVTLGATYFRGKMDDLIETVAAGGGGTTRANGAEAEIDGVELFMSVEILKDQLFLDADWSFVNSEVTNVGNQQGSTFFKGMELLRRPDSSGSVSLRYYRGRFNGTAVVNIVGPYQDADFSPFDFFAWQADPVRNEGYTTVDLALNYNATDWAQINVRGENIFDEDYQAAYGFSNPGAAWRGGLTIQF